MAVVIFGTTTLTPYQVQLASGTIAGAGTSIGLKSISGLRDLPATRYQDQDRGQADGSYPGTSYLGERVLQIVWELTLATNLEGTLTSLAAGFQNVTDPASVVMTGGDFLLQQAGFLTGKPVSAITVQLPNRTSPFIVFGRPTKYNVPIDTDYQFGRVNVTSEWTSPDGLLYDGTLVTGSCGLPTPQVGLSWPAAFPWSFGSSTGGNISLNNTGSYPTPPLLVLKGPLSYPRITNANTGEYMDLNIVLGASDTLTVSHQTGVLTLNGTANRNNAVNSGSSFFAIASGTTSLTFSSKDSVAVAGTCTAYILPAYSAA